MAYSDSDRADHRSKSEFMMPVGGLKVKEASVIGIKIHGVEYVAVAESSNTISRSS